MSVDYDPAIQPGRQAGFTLIELMIAVAIVALLLTVALPSFMDTMRKSRRSDAFVGVAKVQQAQERWRSSRSIYGSFADIGNDLATSPGGHYSLTLSTTTTADQNYRVTATAVGRQANDTACATMYAEVDGGRICYQSGSGVCFNGTESDPNRCWAK